MSRPHRLGRRCRTRPCRRQRATLAVRLETLEARLLLSATAGCLGHYCRALPAYVPGDEAIPPAEYGPVEPPGPLGPDSTLVSFELLPPDGSLIGRTVNAADVTTADEVDTFLLDLDAGQTVTVVVQPDLTLQPRFDLLAPDNTVLGSSTAATAGQVALLQTATAASAGTYRVVLTGASATTGEYRITIYLNAAAEVEAFGGVGNNDLASAQPLDGAFVDLRGGSAQRAAVVARRTKDLEEDFESGTLNDEWTTVSSNSAGQIRVGDDIVAAAGSYSLIMDRGTTGAFTLNEAIWTVDLSGITAATLEFSHADSNDEEHPLPARFTGSANGDGVSISQDGATWYRVLDATDVESDRWARVSIDLMAAASSAGIVLDRDFHIKFQQYDNFPLVVDGRAYDEIRIVTTPAVMSEDWYRFTLGDGQTATLAYRALKGDYPTSLELYDATGKLLATGIAALNAEQLIHRYRHATGDRLPGTYYARVVKPAEEYSLLIVRGADFDRELNGALHLPQDLGNGSGAMGFVDAGSSTGLVLQRSFPGPAFNGSVPPDPTLAVGPEQIVVLVNTELAIYDKATSAELFRQSISSSDGFFGTVGASATVFDPWVVFDDQSQRFFIVGIDVALPTRSNLFLAVSEDATPTRGSDWHKYQLDFTHHPESLGLGTLPHFPDYEKLGISQDAVFISGNYYPIATGSGAYAGITALDKSALLSGGPTHVLYQEYFAGLSVFPLNQYDGGSTQYLVEDLGGSSVRLHAVTDVLTNPQRHTIDLQVPAYEQPVDVPQLGGGEPADAIDSRFMNGVWRFGSAWFAHAITEPTIGDGETVVRWYEVATHDFPAAVPTLVQSGNVDPGPQLHAWMPAIAVDGLGNLAIGFSLGGPQQYYGAGFTGRLATDPLGQTALPVTPLIEGRQNYQRLDGSGRNRWGDYSGLAVDPADDRTFWVFNEYAELGNRWATRIGSFVIDPAPDRDEYRIHAKAGDLLQFRTYTPFADTPFADPGDLVNELDPALVLHAADGTPLAAGRIDGTTKLLTYRVVESGEYRVSVSAQANRGAYLLRVTGARGSETAPEVIGSSPADGQLLTAFPTVYRLEFSEQIAVDSVAPGDLSVGGEPASAVRVQGNAVEFQLATPAVIREGAYAVQLRADSITDLQGQPLAADIHRSFVLDLVGPRVLATRWNGVDLPADGRLAPGALEFAADLSEDLFMLASARRGPLSPGTDDIILWDRLSGEILPENFTRYDPATDVFVARYNELQEGNYRLSLVSGAGAFEDEAGNALDGEPLGSAADKTPTGNGVPGGNYSLDFVVDADVRELQPFARVAPAGSLIAESKDNAGFVNDASDLDSFRFYAHAGERIAARIQPAQQVTLTAQLYGVTALAPAASSPAAGGSVDLPLTQIPADGYYELRMQATGPTRFTAELTRNAELERRIAASDSLPRLAIDGSYLAFDSGRFAVLGTSELKLDFARTNDPTRFVDISSTGTALDLEDDEEYSFDSSVGNRIMPPGAVTIGNDGGLLQGRDRNLYAQNLSLPALDIDAALFPFWDDLDDESGNVYYAEQQVDGINTLIVQWQDRPHYDGFGAVTFQLQLFETGDVLARFVYRDVDFGRAVYDFGASATIGYQSSEEAGFEFSFGGADFEPPIPPTNRVDNGDVVDLTTVPDVDEYLVDLAGRAGQRIDVLLTGADGVDFADAKLELLDANGLVLANAGDDPWAANNFDRGILGFVVPEAGDTRYTLRVTSMTVGHYSLVVTDSLVFDTEPNDRPVEPLRSLNDSHGALGYLAGPGDLDRYQLQVAAGQWVFVTLQAIYDHPDKTPLNSLNPEVRVLAAEGTTVLYADADSLDGKGARISFRSNADELLTIEVLSTSGQGEYVLQTEVADTDFGDADTPFATTLSDDGARHAAWGPRLGRYRDGEVDGQPSASADADDLDAVRDDEDGVDLARYAVGQVRARLSVSVQNVVDHAHLNAWVDFDGDGSWSDSEEQIAQDLLVTAGNNGIEFRVPPTAVVGLRQARFRLSSATGLSPTGLAVDGEVEDHLIEIVDFNVAPRITAVHVGSSQWMLPFVSEIDPLQGLGYSVPAGVTQFNTLPWSNLNRIYVSFDKDLAGVDPSSISLRGVNRSDYTGLISEVSYANRVATISLSNHLAADRLLLVVRDSVVDVAGNPLDGEWTDGVTRFPSGDGIPGGAFLLRWNVLPGDANQKGGIGSSDIGLLRSAMGSTLGQPGYGWFVDLNGDGGVDTSDIRVLRKHLGDTLPDGEPNPPLASRPATVPPASESASPVEPLHRRSVATTEGAISGPAPNAVDAVLADAGLVKFLPGIRRKRLYVP